MTDNQVTRIFVVGGLTGQSNEDITAMQRACELLGESIGSKPGHQIVVCSAHPSSADANVIKGFARTSQNQPGNVIVHLPLEGRSGLGSGESIREQWDVLIRDNNLAEPKFRESSEARVTSTNGFSNAFLLCQIRALKENTDVIVAVGGKREASAAQLLAIARDNYPIVPFAFLGGASEQEYLRQQSMLRSSFRDLGLVDALESPTGVCRATELVEKIRHAHGHYRVFLSYPWKRSQEADYIEAFLRRDPKITLFRDEKDIDSGQPISDRILTNLKDCDAFLALWCAEYAASPHCYDELHKAIEQKGCLVYILRLDDTRPVWPTLRGQGSLDWKDKWELATSRKKVTARLTELLQMLRVRRV